MIDLFGLKSKKKIKELEKRIRDYEIGVSLKTTVYRPITVRAKHAVSGQELGRVKNLDSFREVIKKTLYEKIIEQLVEGGCITVTEGFIAIMDRYETTAEMKVLKADE